MGPSLPSIKEIEETIVDLAATGVDVMITEFDITVIPNPYELAGIARDEFKKLEGDKNESISIWDSENIKKLTKRYKEILSYL